MKLFLCAFLAFQLSWALYAPHTLLAKPRDDAEVHSLWLLYANAGAVKVTSLSTSGIDIITFANFVDISTALRTLQQSNLLEFAERDPIQHLNKVPNDPDFKELWNFNNTENPGVDISAIQAWDLATGSEDIIVAVIDTGLDYNHIDIKQNAWVNKKEIPDNGIDDDRNGFIDDYHGWNFVINTKDPMDDHSHGSHTAGTIGATGNNRIGITGVNWRVKVMPLKSFDSRGEGKVSDSMRALDYSVKMGAHLTSNSYGGDEYSEAFLAQLKACRKANQLFVVAAGNDAKDIDETPDYPASYKSENVLPVAAHDNEDNLADFSNYGVKTVAVAAPGVDVLSLAPGGSYGHKSGTSMACPHVAGIAALALSYKPALKTDVVKLRKILATSVTKASAYEGKVASGGRINAYFVLKNCTNI